MALPATANFTGTNGNEVRSLADWDGALTDALSGGACEIQSNQAQASASGTIGADWYTSETFSNDQKASATVKAITSGVYIGVAVRCSGTDNAGTLTGYLFYSDSADGCYIDKIVSGSYVASIAGPGTVFSVNDTIELSISGSALTAKVNGTTRLSTTDTAITTGRPGIAAYGTGASAIDDWTGDNLSIGGSGTLSVTLAGATSSAAGALAIKGSATPTLAAATLSSAAALANTGALTKTLDNATVSSAGTGGSAPITGALTSTLADATVSAAGTVAIVGTLTKTLDAATVSSAGTIGATGALTATLADATVVARGYHLESACIGGVLTVDGTNARYVRNTAGIVYLAGFHTWYNVQDGGPTDPPPAFDWDEYLAALVSYGCNFTKIWASLETAQLWADPFGSVDNPQYFAPNRYERTGPGTAADGKPKFDLTQISADFRRRLRERVIEAGNAGIYCVVQLFQGWQIDTKGGSDNPWTYHPYRLENNINSVDGDNDNDGEGTETHTDSGNNVLAYQEAMVEAIIDTLNDLDNVIWEISNEDTGSTNNTDWQEYLISYIATYEAGKPKQHLIGRTVCWPNGDNAALDASAASWVSYNGDKADVVHSASDPVSFRDSDHVEGIATDYPDLIFEPFCNGHGGSWYMDPWDGAVYGTDTTSDATYNRIRRLTGDVRGYAERMDLANATPQASLSTTNYCIAKTTGIAQILVYQPGTGAFDLTLTSISGTFTLEWFRVSDGSTQAGSDVTGGAVRTLTPPWSGAVAAFLELSGAAGTLTATLADATVSSTGALAITATSTTTLDGATVNSTGTVVITATSTTTLAAATVSSTATLANTGTLTATLESATLAATGAIGAFAVGALTATLADATATSTATLAIAGATTATLEAATLSSAAALANTGTLTATLASATVVAVGVEVVIVSIVAGAIRGAGASGTVHGAGTAGTVRA